MSDTPSQVPAKTNKKIKKNIEKAPKFIPLKKIIAKVKKTGKVSDAAKLLGCSESAIYQRFKKNNLNVEDFTDYTEDKALSHEILQYRIANGFTNEDIKKMPGGSKVLAICQLQDKISTLRDGNANKNNSLQVIINLANRAEEIDVTPGRG